jgi:hypothetical protein
MRSASWACVVCLLFLTGGCHLIDTEHFPAAGQVDLVAQVRERLPSLRPGMTEAQVQQALSDLPLGEETVVSMTISGGKTIQYRLAKGRYLEFTFIPQSLSEPPPGRLTEVRLGE